MLHWHGRYRWIWSERDVILIDCSKISRLWLKLLFSSISNLARLLENVPLYSSSSTVVLHAIDTLSLDNLGKPCHVALKFLLNKDRYRREIDTRACKLSDEYVLNVLANYPKYRWSCDVVTMILLWRDSTLFILHLLFLTIPHGQINLTFLNMCIIFCPIAVPKRCKLVWIPPINKTFRLRESIVHPMLCRAKTA